MQKSVEDSWDGSIGRQKRKKIIQLSIKTSSQKQYLQKANLLLIFKDQPPAD